MSIAVGEPSMFAMDNLSAPNPLILTNRSLDTAIEAGWQNFFEMVQSREPNELGRWIAIRSQSKIDGKYVSEILSAMAETDDLDEIASLASELAELVAETDPELAAACWEGVSRAGFSLNDGELIFEGAIRSSELEAIYGDPRTAAEFLIQFLNWRRRPGHVSDPEFVMTALEETGRLADVDGNRKASAEFEFHLSQFLNLSDEDREIAESGDWIPDSPPFTAWD